MTPTVRDATIVDAEAIARVHVRSWQHAYAGLMPADLLAGLSVADRATAWADRLTAAANPLLVVTVPEVVGFAAFGPNPTDPARGHLYAIYLDPSWWGRGAGRLLHDEVVARLDEHYPHSTLWVLRGNDRATRFYRAAGWQPDGTTNLDERDEVTLLEDGYVRSSLNPRWESANPSRA